MLNIDKQKQKGEVSLFVVIFAALLITVVTVSFARIMTQSQRQASSIDLSQSAYDSAQAGVEDAKRAIIRYQNICDNGGDCAAAKNELSSSVCNEAIKKLNDIPVSGDEIQVQSLGDENALNQAYTCVKITPDTIDYQGVLLNDSNNIIPLRGVSSFDTIQIRWFTGEDINLTSNNAISLLSEASGLPLFGQTASISVWPQNRPPILRTQLIQFASDGFNLSDFNNASGEQSNANTLFLYPTNSNIDTPYDFRVRDTRYVKKLEPLAVSCKTNISNIRYACVTTLRLPRPIGSGDRTAFLRLGALYNDAHFQITLSDSATPGTNINFDEVQILVDSTGRANDMFKRVQTRIELNTNFPYPDAEINITGNFCKDFRVTDNEEHYQPGDCTP